eukprot:scaffold2230_cov166-Skeletonema_menzelii.AAC.4
MTIDAEEWQGAPAAPQAINNDDDLKSLVRILADRSKELAERVAFLERGTVNKTSSQEVETDDDEVLPPRVSSFDVSSERIPENTNNTNDVEKALQERIKLLEQRMEDYEDEKDALLGNINGQGEYHLVESTFSLLITEHPLSVPFMFGVLSMTLSISCLSLTLTSSINKGTSRNPLGIPAGVAATTRVAQFLGALVGVLMEDEIPQGLQYIANAAGHKLFLNGQQQKEVRMRIAQNRDVIEIFYDVLALEFVENIDDTTFALAKRGFFGRRMLFATNKQHTLHMSEMRNSLALGTGRNRGALDGQVQSDRRLSYSGLIASKSRVNFLVKVVYFLNAIIIFVGLGYISKTQYDGMYRTRSIRVIFDEEIWEKANVLIGGNVVQRLLIYSYFNGIYEEAGSYGGYPRYVERSKNQGAISLNEDDGGTLFGPDSMPGAEMVYCTDIGRWIFRHPNITTSAEGGEGNECSWLWKSAETDDYDILSTNDGVWEAWVGSNGKVKPQVSFSVMSNECNERSDCNYHGKCVENHCKCDIGYFGEACQFDWPCETLATEKAHTLGKGTFVVIFTCLMMKQSNLCYIVFIQNFEDKTRGMVWNMKNPIRLVRHSVYNRPLFIQTGLTGEPYDMRLYKILEVERSVPPSNQPSIVPSTLPSLSPTLKPSLSQQPSSFPSQSPSISTQPTNIPSVSIEPTKTPTKSPISPGTVEPTSFHPTGFASDFPTVLEVLSIAENDDQSVRDPPDSPQITFEENEYDTAPDFADVDDFFERQPLHDLEQILEDYSVVLTFTGSRFYGTIIKSNASLDELFPDNYHAFWDQSFNVNRTFIISDTTFGSSPVGVDFYEMRRRINGLLNPDIHFSYGPYGAMIPLMDYEGTGFFHCMDETAHPSVSPSSSPVPSQQPSISQHPTDQCINVEVNIFTDTFPQEISWALLMEATDANGDEAESIATSDDFFYEPESLVVSNVCLYEGNYTFTIRDSVGDGIFDPGYYSVTSNGVDIKRGGGSNGFTDEESVSFSVPYSM